MSNVDDSGVDGDVDAVEQVAQKKGRGAPKGKRKRAPAAKKQEASAEESSADGASAGSGEGQEEEEKPAVKEPSKLALHYLKNIAPAIAHQKAEKNRQTKFNLRTIDEFFADKEIRVQQFLSLLHFIDQPSLVVETVFFDNGIPFVQSKAGIAKLEKMEKELADCPDDLRANFAKLQEKYSQHIWKLPPFDEDDIRAAISDSPCKAIRIVLVKTSLETFFDSRNKKSGVSDKRKQVKFLNAHFRYEPVFESAPKIKRVVKKRKTEGESGVKEEATKEAQEGVVEDAVDEPSIKEEESSSEMAD